MQFTVAAITALALAVGAQAQITLSLYTDNACSVLAGSVTLDGDTCTQPTIPEWSSMDLASEPENGGITIYSKASCTGDNATESAMFLGCMDNFGFEARSLQYTA